MLNKIVDFTHRFFWLFLFVALALGLFFPNAMMLFEPYIIWYLIVMMYLVFLKVDVKDVFGHLKKPVQIIYVQAMLLVIVPIVFYLLALVFVLDIAVGVLLLVAVPPAIATSVLTDLFGGRVSLTLMNVMLCYMIAPFVFPFVVTGLISGTVSVSGFDLFLALVKLIFIPLLAAQITKLFAKRVIDRTKHSYSMITVLCMMLIVVSAVSKESVYLFAHVDEALYLLIVCYVVVALLHIVGYYMAFWLPRKDRISVTVTRAYANLGFAIVLAYKFFDGKTTLLLVLAVFAVNTMPLPFKMFLKWVR